LQIMGGKRHPRMLEERLRAWAADRGYGLAIAGPGVIETVKRKLEERRSSKMIDQGFSTEILGGFKYLDGVKDPAAKRIVVVSMPSPIHVLAMMAGDRRIEASIPPTYVRYRGTFEDVLADMKANVLDEEAEAEILKVPLKSLAVHMGLVVYGRNNITYAPGLGSGHQLCGYIVGSAASGTYDGRAEEHASETALERCSHCRACVQVCPTGAIREGRFLISAERCFTLHSESRRPIPAWAKPPKSVCLIGCMDCQSICPENANRLKTVPAGVEFTAEETEAVIEAGRRLGSVTGGAGQGVVDLQQSAAWRSARAKFDRLEMSEDLEVMGRNLDYYLTRSESGSVPSG
jgi:epoxyqueuosine reductase